MTPDEGVRLAERRAHHALTDGLEDLGGAEFRDEEAEAERMLLRGALHVGSRTGAAGDEVVALQRLDGLGDGDARRAEALAENGLAGEAVANGVLAGLDLGQKLLVDHTMKRLGLRGPRLLPGRGTDGVRWPGAGALARSLIGRSMVARRLHVRLRGDVGHGVSRDSNLRLRIGRSSGASQPRRERCPVARQNADGWRRMLRSGSIVPIPPSRSTRRTRAGLRTLCWLWTSGTAPS